MQTGKHLFITGGLGFLGRHLVPHLLAHNHRLTLLIRCSEEKARQQLQLHLPHSTHWPRIQFVLGDITDTGWHNDPTIGPIDEMIHAASLVSFSEKEKDLQFKINVEGTQNLLAFAHSRQVNRVHYVSTAYTCGKQEGPISETITPEQTPPSFHNPYEASKFWAEQTVASWHHQTGIPITILRPSILISPHPTSSRLGYYAFASLFYTLGPALKKLSKPVILNADPEAFLNLISVEDVAKIITLLISTSPTLPLPQVYHLTHPSPPSVRQVTEAPLEWMGLHQALRFSCEKTDGSTPSDTAKFSKLILTKLKEFLPYLEFQGRFLTGNVKALEPNHNPTPITDLFLYHTLAHYLPTPSRLEKASVSAAIFIAKKLIDFRLNPSGLPLDKLYSFEAKSYKKKHHLTTAGHDQTLRYRAAQWAAEHLGHKPGHVIDLASGTGLTLEALEKTTTPETRLTGIEWNPDMIAHHRPFQRPTTQLQQGDAQHFISDEIPPNSVDVITLVFGIGGIENYQACFNEMIKALKPGGIAVLTDIYAPSLKKAQCKGPFYLPASVHLVKEAWEKVTLPVVLKQLWGWQDPTPCFEALSTTFHQTENIRYKFEIISLKKETLPWWFGLPVMPICELVVRKMNSL